MERGRGGGGGGDRADRTQDSLKCLPCGWSRRGGRGERLREDVREGRRKVRKGVESTPPLLLLLPFPLSPPSTLPP